MCNYFQNLHPLCQVIARAGGNQQIVKFIHAVPNCVHALPVLAASDMMATNFSPFMKLFF